MAAALSFHPPVKLLVVEDHLALLDAIVETLLACGHEVIGIDSAEALDQVPAHFVAEIVVLDINLPGENGLSLAQRLRRIQPGIGIIMVTALHALEHKLAGYEHGADLYLTKPVAPQELCATVMALAQRVRQSSASQPPAFTLDTVTHLLHTPQGELVLSQPESTLLHALALAPDHTLEVFQVLERLDKPVDASGKTQLEVMISRLRSKLVAHGVPAVPIRSVRGKGYRLCMPLRLS